MSEEFSANLLSRLAKIGIDEPWELILNLPNSYDNFIKPMNSIAAIRKVEDGQFVYGCLILSGVRTSEDIEKKKKADGVSFNPSRVPYVSVELTDGNARVTGMQFGSTRNWVAAGKTSLKKKVFFYGKKGTYNNFPSFTDVSVVPVADQGRLVARYSGKEKVISPEKVGQCVQIAIMHYMDQCVDYLLDKFGEDEQDLLNICDIKFHSLKHLLTTLHLPRTQEDLNAALVAARRLNAYFGVREALSHKIRNPEPRAAIPVDRDLIAKLVADHPFTPTRGQRAAIWDIIKDLGGQTPMDRLLSADVGNGKTMAYGIPAAYVASKNKNAVILLPTEPLANQVASNIKSWYPDTNVHLVTQGFSGQVLRGDILVGTTAVLTWLENNPEWTADLAIVDEQQKLGSQQIQQMVKKHTHFLEATATPIPRTMALSVFGGKSISVINDSPVKKFINTKLIGTGEEEMREAMACLVHRVKKEGKKIAVIYPLVVEQDAYVYHINVETKERASEIAKRFRAAGASIKELVDVKDEEAGLRDECQAFSEGFVAEVWADAQAAGKLSKRFDKYFEGVESAVTFVGSKVDARITERNSKTILQGAKRWESLFPGRVAVIHGRSKKEEKSQIIDRMNNGEADVLLSTTLIEIGIDVKDLAGLAVVGAENLGAFTLHQLRGRIARNGGEGNFFMIASKPLNDLEPEALDRMRLLERFTSGDEIARHDMNQRGFGSLGVGGKAQAGFEDGIFPKMKLTPSELEGFLKEVTSKKRMDYAVEP